MIHHLQQHEFFQSTISYVSGVSHVASANGVRLIINIKGDAKISGGIGTANNPFEISFS